ncbi:MAG: putative DNA modification/repair radical SAM protein [Treponema sp.]|jgi:putative DNA modification/repair radical SAM protein|nr:putative DNA modification/repair radical SAM protein [Treponema sp.]
MVYDLGEKISILAGAAKYDASCASSGSDGFSGMDGKRGKNKVKFGKSLPMGVCHSWTEDGRCVSLLKVLYSNICKYDCAYCVNRMSADIPRTTFNAPELAELTCEFYKRNYIEGLFLSSGIFADPDIVMEKLTETARLLRKEKGYGGYIHLKIIPGTGEKMIREAGLWADRLSVNIELPTEKSLNCLAPDKSAKSIFGAMGDFSCFKSENEEARYKSKFLPRGKAAVPDFAPAGQSTQLIVGATDEDDKQIINLSSSLYRKFSLKRVYYSAFIHPGRRGSFAHSGAKEIDPRLPGITPPPLAREHRLYQADWLLRFYHFNASEILSDDEQYLDTHLDPKTAWALKNLDFFPVEINRADYETLLRIPGIGAKTARRVIETRRGGCLSFDNLRRMGAVLKRARYFTTCSGRAMERPDDPGRIRRFLSDTDGAGLQLPLFEF